MSEEEKKAIEWFKKDLMFWLIEGKDYVIIDNGEIPKMKSLLNLIEKQQKEIEEKTTIIMAGAKKVKQLEKEIEELKQNKKDNIQVVYGGRRFGTEGMVVKDYISKDKIREKIKKYDKWILEGGDYTESLEEQRYALNELLEED